MGVQSPSTLPTEATTGGCMGPPSNFYLNLQYIVHTVPSVPTHFRGLFYPGFSNLRTTVS